MITHVTLRWGLGLEWWAVIVHPTMAHDDGGAL